ncbi:MAG: hypothetical protein AB1656_01095 [Candidatus Omnitrophota bacterium]
MTMGQSADKDLFIDSANRWDALDLFLLSQEWGKDDPSALKTDLDGNGKIDKWDLMLFIQSYHAVVSATAPTPTPTVTPTEIPSATDTPTPSPTEIPSATDTPTPTPTEISSATETPTPTEIPIATDTPTPTATPIPSTPTSGPVEITPTPTLTPTPSSTPEPVVDTPTPEEATPTPTETPIEATPTPTEIPAPSQFEPYSMDFDSIDELPGGGISTVQDAPENWDVLYSEGRIPADNLIVPWVIVTEKGNHPYGAVISPPHSAGFNSKWGDSYQSWQTSILVIDQVFNTSGAAMPTLSFEIAFSLDAPIAAIEDFLIVEATYAGQWQPLDLNSDGMVVTDKTAFTNGVLAKGSFDGFFGQSNPTKDPYDPLTQEDFIHIETVLPKAESLRIAFRFQSDSSYTAEGAYLDNIRVFDNTGGATKIPEIRKVEIETDDALYADAENAVSLTGVNLTSVEKAIFTLPDGGDVELPFTETTDGLHTVLPPLSQVDQDATVKISVVVGGIASEHVSLTYRAAPKPVITQISPTTFYQASEGGAILAVYGQHFRPALAGSAAGGTSAIVVSLGLQEVELPVLSASLTELLADASPLKALSPGLATVIVRNASSQLESAGADLKLDAGTGEGGIEISEFLIIFDGTNVSFHPAEEIYPLQQDQAFTLVCNGTGLTDSKLNIDVGGKPYVVEGNLAPGIDGSKVDYFESPFGDGVDLTFSPMVIDATGDIPVSLRIGNAMPVTLHFNLSAPLRPLLYSKDGDWSSITLSDIDGSGLNDLYIAGDNFRGSSSLESTTRIYLFPAEIENPAEQDLIPLPIIENFIDINIQLTAIFSDDSMNLDELFQFVPETTIATYLGWKESETVKEFRLRIVNPDSGLYVDSPPVVEGEPKTVLTITRN